MRLIDADKIKYEPYWGPADENGNKKLLHRAKKEDIDNIPTVEIEATKTRRLLDVAELKNEIRHRCVLSELNAHRPLCYGETDLFEILDGIPEADAVSLKDYQSMERTVNKLSKALADAKPIKHGRWIDVQEDKWVYARCSVCETLHDVKSNYCPNCGSRMDEVDNGKNG